MNALSEFATKMQDLDATIEQKLDFVFHVTEEDELLTLRSTLGFARRLIHVRSTSDSIPGELTIPLKREPRKIGASLKEIIQGAGYTYRVSERIGYSIVTLEGASLAEVTNLIAACLHYVESKLAD